MCGGPAQTGRLDPSVVAESPEESGSVPAAEGPTPSDARQASDTPGCEGSEVTLLLSLDARLAEEAGGPAQLERNGRWRRKIQATFPLILVKTHNRTTSTTGLGDQPRDCAGEEEEESDFEEIFLPAPESPVGSGRPLHQEPPAEGADFLPGDPAPCVPPSSSHEDPPAAQLGRRGQPASEYLDLVVNALRRSFRISGTAAPKAVARSNGAARARPRSEGSFSFNSLSPRVLRQHGRRRPARDPAAGVPGLRGPQGRPGRPAPQEAELLLLHEGERCEGAERAGREGRSSQDKDIWTIISDLRNKVSNPQQQDSSSSSEEESGVGKQRGTSGPRKRRKQEEVVKQQARREQLKRLHRAQVIQRQLEEVEEKQRALEERGVALEKLLRGETEDRSQDEAQHLQTWFRLVLEKNKLARYESELVIFAQELELEDTQSQLQQKLRRRMAVDSSRKSAWEQAEEQQIFSEMMRVVEKRDALVSLLEEQRLKERAEDQDLESLVLTKGYRLHWA
ncbi:hypothetical protein ANANG_G00209280 [Anguilla anguilla]|uniref:BMERB domain-containing protein n=1 Tax=Anguilla anguilla TaxID=7936 RepID=A0A9D3LZI5_ANGAN|nr:hypothetical protein ANANG_G00209280 [Anguilla anguilla]